MTSLPDYTHLEKRVLQAKIDALDYAQEHQGLRHFGGAFSSAHVVAALYREVLTGDDKFLLSKGHTCSVWYSFLRERGYDPRIQGHPERDPKNGTEITAGSLGHGFPMGLGMAFAKKLQKEPGRIYVLMGDGECQEGTTYESIALAENYKLDNLVVIVDSNRIQGSGFLVEPTVDYVKRLVVPSWDFSEINGHDFAEVIPALKKTSTQPRMIIAKTTKGYGVSFMENVPEWHSKAAAGEDYVRARQELVSKLEKLS